MTPCKVLFHSNQLGIRGTEIALYDYADYNEKILGNTSYVVYPNNSDLTAIDKFHSRFRHKLLPYNDFNFLENVCKDLDISHAYFIKYGTDDGKLIPGVKNIVHAVFDGSQPHGDIYVVVSEWLSKKYNVDYLSHIVSLPDSKEDFREFLNIPKNATVFGRYGGYDQFDVPYLSEAIFAAADKGKYFLLMNTKPLDHQHKNIIYLDASTDLYTKTAFINTCDAMLHGRTEGETFGLSISEFLHQDKPVITNITGKDKNQVLILKDKGFYYSDVNELTFILLSFEKKIYEMKSLISEFSPEKIMSKFKTFLS
jgi:hypothetical protein